MDRSFRRNLVLVCAAHVIGLAAIYFFQHRGAIKEEITWLDSEAAPESGAHKALEENADEATPAPMPTPEAGGGETPAPSEIVLPGAQMTPVETPPPTATPTPTPTARPTATPTPKPTPKSTPKPTPKAKPKASPKPHVSPKPSPKKTAKSSPHPSAASDDSDDGDSESAATPGKTTGKKAKGASGAGTGNAKTGGGHAGGGGTSTEYGWYYAMIHDRFYSRWEQPTSIVTSDQNFVALVKIRIEKDGRISNVALAKSSGNVVMDESVMAAAKRVTQIDPLPEGLGEGSYEININFQLNQSQ